MYLSNKERNTDVACLPQLKHQHFSYGKNWSSRWKTDLRGKHNNSCKCLLVITLLNYQLNRRKKDEVFSFSLHCFTNTSSSLYVHALIHANVLRHSLCMHSPAPFKTSQMNEVQFPSQCPSWYEHRCKIEDWNNIRLRFLLSELIPSPAKWCNPLWI